MDKPKSSTTFIDLTEDDGEGVLNSGPPLNSATVPRQRPSKPASHPNVEPIVLDLTDDVEGRASTEKKVKSNGTAGRTQQTSGYAFLNQPKPNRPEKRRTASSGVTQYPARNSVNNTQGVQPLTSRDVYLGVDRANARETWKEYRKSNPNPFFSSSRKQSKVPSRQPSHQAAPVSPLVRRPEPPAITPQKRKQSSSSVTLEQPVFRSPPKTTWKDTSVAENVSSSTSEPGTNSQPYPALTQRPKTISQTPPRISPSKNGAYMPQARVFNSFSEMFPSKENESSSGSTSLSSRDDSMFQPGNTANVPTPGSTSTRRLSDGRVDISQDTVPDMSVSPTSSSFPPGFDRGRYPLERRRRGGLGVPNPYPPRKRQSGTFSGKTLQADVQTTPAEPTINRINGVPALRNPFSAGESSTSLLPGSNSEADAQRSLGSYQNPNVRSEPDANDEWRLRAGARSMEQNPPKRPSEHSLRQDCHRCVSGPYACDRAWPKCTLCGILGLGCTYNGAQHYPGSRKPSAEASKNQTRLAPKPPPNVSSSRNSQQNPNAHEQPASAIANISQQNQGSPSIAATSNPPSVRIKQEDSDEEEPDSTLRYLDPRRRTRGWHHDGYADVRSLFQRIAMDAVRKKKGEYADWPLDLERTAAQVTRKAEDVAKQKFGYFVKRLSMSDGKSYGSVPNVADVEWIQRKVSETFLAEANRATTNVDDSPPDSALAEGSMATSQSSIPPQVSGERRASEIDRHQTRSRGSIPSGNTNSATISRTSSQPDLRQISGGSKTSESDVPGTMNQESLTSGSVDPRFIPRPNTPLLDAPLYEASSPEFPLRSAKSMGKSLFSSPEVPLRSTRSIGKSHPSSPEVPLRSARWNGYSRPSSPEVPLRNTQSIGNSRPSRIAAGTAASRITSQYTIYGRHTDLQKDRPGIVHNRRLCSDCKEHYSVVNWGVHLRTLKHRENASRTGLEAKADMRMESHKQVNTFQEQKKSAKQEQRLCRYCDVWILVKNWGIHLDTQKHRDNFAIQAHREKPTIQQDRDSADQKEAQAKAEDLLEGYQQDHTGQEGTEDIKKTPALWGFPLEAHSDKVLETRKLEPRRKRIQGTHLQSLAASIAILEHDALRPYQGFRKRGNIDKDARLDLLSKHSLLRHVDFAADEMAMIGRILVRDKHGAVDVTDSMANAYISGAFTDNERQWMAIKSQTQYFDKSLRAESPTFDLIESRVQDPNARSAHRIGSLLRHRELGSSAVGRNVETQSELKTRLSEAIKPWRSFKGASHDVVTVAWAPNSLDFAAGAAAHSNSEDLQYNRSCNLLLGDLRRNTLTELPDHCIDRQKLPEGLNSSQNMFNACDPKVYKTVYSIKFHPSVDQMYTASEDQTVKVWDLSEPNPLCIRTLQHDASVTGLDISPVYTSFLATASRSVNNAIKVFDHNKGGRPLATFSSARAFMRPEWQIYPESLLWGPSRATCHLLLAGFNACGQDGEITSEGHLCLWDALTGQDLKPLPASQAIHSAAWHPSLPCFATGGAAGFDKTNRFTTKTVVRAWDYRFVKRLAVEYECPAREMTDVTFHPLDQNIAIAGCTDSTSYVWDFRWPDQPLHQLRHGKSIMTTGERDTGVMMSLWGTGNSLYYTGSSDGEIRAWDIRRHPNDVLVNTVARLGAGIQSGAFSPDGTHLLVGDATGGVHVLSSTPWEPYPDPSVADDIETKGTSMKIIRATDIGDDNPGTLGIEAAQELLDSGQISLDPVYGPGKGPCYSQFWATENREPSPFSSIGKLKREVYKQQAFSLSGEERPAWATPIREIAAARKELIDMSRKDDGEVERATRVPAEPPDHPVASGNSDRALIPLSNLTTGTTDPRNIPKRAAFGSLPDLARTTTPMSANLDGAPETLSTGSRKPFTVPNQSLSERTDVVEDNIISESEMVEENGWWPRLGEEEITQALKRPGVIQG